MQSDEKSLMRAAQEKSSETSFLETPTFQGGEEETLPVGPQLLPVALELQIVDI
jgi:hypothetical protein